jgi:CHAD domain-containing protein
VKKDKSAAAYHDLRKGAKQLWYQLRILRPLHPAVFHDMNADLKALGQHLGHSHDLCFVAERLQALGGANTRNRSRRALEALIDSREKDLQRTAVALAERFYAEKPKAFSARIADYFDEWERTKLRKSRELRIAA